jgi:leader peptidase (prepilin peptidase) / N-methyltransferase
MVEATAAPLTARPVRRGLMSAAAAVPLAAASVAVFGPSLKGVLGAFFVTVLVLLTIIDLEERRLPNVIVLPAFAIVLAAHLALSPGRAVEWVVAGFGAALLLFLPSLVVPGGMGMGDFKLALLLGAMLGKAVVMAILIASIAGGLVAVGLLLARGAAARKQSIPFGPFLAVGGVVALFLGDALAL